MHLRIYAHFGVESGFGRAATDLALAWNRREGDTLSCRAMGAPPVLSGRKLPLAPAFQNEAAPDVVLVHTLPWDLPRAAELIREDVGMTPVVGLTAWEASLPIALAQLLDRRFSMLDQIWVPSTANAWQFAELDYGEATPGRGAYLKIVPHTYDDVDHQMRWAPPNENAPYRFYWMGAWNARKNPAGLIRAFAHEFGAGEPVELTLHSPGASGLDFVEALASTGLERNDLRVVLDPVAVADDEVLGIHRRHDCFVTASRGEAWNLGAFEAALAGRHVIAPHGQGSSDYLLGSSAQLYETWLVPAHIDMRASQVMTPSGNLGYQMAGSSPKGLTARCTWSEPQYLALAKAMRDAFEHRRRRITLSYDPAQRFGYAAVASIMHRHLSEVLQ